MRSRSIIPVLVAACARAPREPTAAARAPGRAELLQLIAIRFGAIGGIVDDPDMQQFLDRCVQSRRPQDLRRLDDRTCR